jgi:hypothetical protein
MAYTLREVTMDERELRTKTDTERTPEKPDQGMDEGTGMGTIWDIQRFRRLLEEEKARIPASKT